MYSGSYTVLDEFEMLQKSVQPYKGSFQVLMSLMKICKFPADFIDSMIQVTSSVVWVLDI